MNYYRPGQQVLPGVHKGWVWLGQGTRETSGLTSRALVPDIGCNQKSDLHSFSLSYPSLLFSFLYLCTVVSLSPKLTLKLCCCCASVGRRDSKRLSSWRGTNAVLTGLGRLPVEQVVTEQAPPWGVFYQSCPHSLSLPQMVMQHTSLRKNPPDLEWPSSRTRS
jgi:hypothetical protein